MSTSPPRPSDTGTPEPHPSRRSERGLDWLNFFVADVETGFGPFIAVYLAANEWTQGNIGLILSVGSLAAIVSQLPGGALVDSVRRKRLLVAIALLMIAAGGLILFFSHAFLFVLLAQVLHGSTTGLITPARSAIGLGLVGHAALSRRLGRNHRFDSLGNGGTAALMGLLGHFVAKRASFLFATLLCVPALWSLSRIKGEEIDYARARSGTAGQANPPSRCRDLLTNRNLVIFACVLILFQVANAPVLPLVSERLAHHHARESELVVSGLVIVPQAVAAVLASWFAAKADEWGRKPLLLTALGALLLRILSFTVVPGPWYFLGIQVLSGLDAAVIGILTPLVIEDVTAGSGRYNLAQGAVGVVIAGGAAFSTTAIGFVSQWFGPNAALLVLTGVAAGAIGFAALLLPETRPG